MKEQSAYVFNRPQYIGEEEYIEKSTYTCCNCGGRLEKNELADHATICKDPYEKIGEEIKRIEKQCNKIDYSMLRQGMKVKIKSWERMAKEYGMSFDNDIDCEEFYIHYSKEDELYIQNQKNRILKIKEICTEDNSFFIDNLFFDLPMQCIESIIDSDDQLQTNQKYDYTPPKRVKALWLGQIDGDVEYKDAYYLYVDNKYIGIENGKKRFSLYYENGQEIGIIGTNCCALSDSDNYYIFETARDLYLWMAEGEE